MSNRRIQALFASQEARLLRKPRALKDCKAIDAMVHCRTPSMGTHYYACEQGHRVEQHHSCRHRSCYVCAQLTRAQWVDRQQQRLLDTPHFHVIFTLPHEYLPLWRYNEAWFARALFEASQRSLLQLLGQEEHGGYRPGILMSLHTWGRQLTLHPHTHCLVTAGGVSGSGEWRESGNYLLPVAVLKAVYRGKVQALLKQAFEQGELTLPPSITEPEFRSLHRGLYKKAWSVRIEERYDHGRGVLLYLARYCKGGPLNPDQLLGGTHERVLLRYFDHRTKRQRVLMLSPEQLCERLLQHVPSAGVHTIRYYGLYASATKLHPACRGMPERLVLAHQGVEKVDLLQCRGCGGMLRCIGIRWPGDARKGNSIYKEASGVIQGAPSGGYVQQDVEADTASGALINSS